MKAALTRLGDAMLSRVLPAAEAGAVCCIGAGTKCKCGSPCGVTWCTQYYVACTCQCIPGYTHC